MFLIIVNILETNINTMAFARNDKLKQDKHILQPGDWERHEEYHEDAQNNWQTQSFAKGATSNECQRTEPEDLNSSYDWTVSNQFIDRVVQELTFDCSLSFTIPKTRIPQIVERVAKWWFRHAEAAVEERWYLVRNCDLQKTPNRTLKLPTQIVSIQSCEMLNSEYKVSMRRATFTLERLLANTINFFGSTTSGSNISINYAGPSAGIAPGLANDYFMQLFEVGQLESILKRTVTFSFNPNTHKFVVLGDNEDSDIVLLTFTRVPLYALFEDERFLKHVVGECMKELKFILSAFGFKLPGGVQLNYQDYQSRGQEWIDEAKQEVLDDTAGDCFIVLTNQ